MRARLLFNTGRQFRPCSGRRPGPGVVAGGGTFAASPALPPAPSCHRVQVSATVNDLQILDNNAQAIQQMDQLLQDDDAGDDTAGCLSQLS